MILTDEEISNADGRNDDEVNASTEVVVAYSATVATMTRRNIMMLVLGKGDFLAERVENDVHA